MKKALIVWGGWEGHQPEEVARLCGEILTQYGFEVDVSNTLDVLTEKGDPLKELSLFVPVWTMGEISHDQVTAITRAVEGGVGIGGCHGGMCDAFRNSTEWQFMTGGQWVAHPGNDGVEYTVRIIDREDPITEGIDDFPVRSEQYYLHCDPSNNVLAVTQFPVADGPHAANGKFDMPVVWTRRHGKGKVFYNSLGHTVDVIASGPAHEILKRGLLWAAR